MQTERDIKIYLLEKNIPIDNVIFYTHSSTLKFNWVDYEKKITEAEFDKICENFDLNRWPGVTLALEGVKQYTG